MKELQPINQNVLLDVTEDSKEQTTASGIIIPETAKEKPKTAEFIDIVTGSDHNIDNQFPPYLSLIDFYPAINPLNRNYSLQKIPI